MCHGGKIYYRRSEKPLLIEHISEMGRFRRHDKKTEKLYNFLRGGKYIKLPADLDNSDKVKVGRDGIKVIMFS